MSCCSGVSFFRNKNNKSILQFYRKGPWLKCRTYKIENCVTYNIPIFLEKDGLEPIRFRGFIRFHCLNSSINFLLWDRSNKQISLSTRNTRMVIKRRVMSRNRLHWTEKRLKMPENLSFNNIIIRTPFPILKSQSLNSVSLPSAHRSRMKKSSSFVSKKGTVWSRSKNIRRVDKKKKKKKPG